MISRSATEHRQRILDQPVHPFSVPCIVLYIAATDVEDDLLPDSAAVRRVVHGPGCSARQIQAVLAIRVKAGDEVDPGSGDGLCKGWVRSRGVGERVGFITVPIQVIEDEGDLKENKPVNSGKRGQAIGTCLLKMGSSYKARDTVDNDIESEAIRR